MDFSQRVLLSKKPALTQAQHESAHYITTPGSSLRSIERRGDKFMILLMFFFLEPCAVERGDAITWYDVVSAVYAVSTQEQQRQMNSSGGGGRDERKSLNKISGQTFIT